MAKYGSDKPDLRNPLIICDLTDMFRRVRFKPFMNKYVRAIVAPCKNERWFFDKSLAFATKQAKMAGLAHITLLDAANYGFKDDPISKVMTEEEKREIVELTGVKEGETIFFICDGVSDVADKNAGVVRTWLGEELGLINKDSFEFCFVVDFPMYERDETTDKIIFTHNPFSMPQGGLEALETMDPCEILAYQYDLVCNGIELASGAVRNHSPEIMPKRKPLERKKQLKQKKQRKKNRKRRLVVLKKQQKKLWMKLLSAMPHRWGSAVPGSFLQAH